MKPSASQAKKSPGMSRRKVPPPNFYDEEDFEEQVTNLVSVKMEGLLITDLMHQLHRKSSKLIDTYVICSNGWIPAHRCVLMASSPFLNNLLINEDPGEVASIALPDFTVKQVLPLISSFYNGGAVFDETEMPTMIALIKLLVSSKSNNYNFGPAQHTDSKWIPRIRHIPSGASSPESNRKSVQFSLDTSCSDSPPMLIPEEEMLASPTEQNQTNFGLDMEELTDPNYIPPSDPDSDVEILGEVPPSGTTTATVIPATQVDDSVDDFDDDYVFSPTSLDMANNVIMRAETNNTTDEDRTEERDPLELESLVYDEGFDGDDSRRQQPTTFPTIAFDEDGQHTQLAQIITRPAATARTPRTRKPSTRRTKSRSRRGRKAGGAKRGTLKSTPPTLQPEVDEPGTSKSVQRSFSLRSFLVEQEKRKRKEDIRFSHELQEKLQQSLTPSDDLDGQLIIDEPKSPTILSDIPTQPNHDRRPSPEATTEESNDAEDANNKPSTPRRLSNGSNKSEESSTDPGEKLRRAFEAEVDHMEAVLRAEKEQLQKKDAEDQERRQREREEEERKRQAAAEEAAKLAAEQQQKFVEEQRRLAEEQKELDELHKREAKKRDEARRKERQRLKEEAKKEEERKAEELKRQQLKELEEARKLEALRLEEERMRAEQIKKQEEQRLKLEKQQREEERMRIEQQKQEQLRLAEQKRQEELRLAEQKKLQEQQQRLAEEKRKEEQRLAEEKRKEEQRLAEEKRKEELRLAEEKRIEEIRLAEQRKEEQRLAEQKRKEEIRLAEQRKEEQRLAEQKRKEERRLAEEKRKEEQRLAAEAILRAEHEKREREAARLAEQKLKEERRLAEKRKEEQRLAKEKERMRIEEQRKQQELRLAEEKERLRLAEEQERMRLAEEKRKEEQRLAEQKRKEEQRLAEQKRKEEQRLAEEKRQHELRLAEEKEKARLAEQKRQEELRLAEEKRVEEEKKSEEAKQKALAEARKLEEAARLEEARQLQEREDAKLAQEQQRQLEEARRIEEQRQEARRVEEQRKASARQKAEDEARQAAAEAQALLQRDTVLINPFQPDKWRAMEQNELQRQATEKRSHTQSPPQTPDRFKRPKDSQQQQPQQQLPQQPQQQQQQPQQQSRTRWDNPNDVFRAYEERSRAEFKPHEDAKRKAAEEERKRRAAEEKRRILEEEKRRVAEEDRRQEERRQEERRKQEDLKRKEDERRRKRHEAEDRSRMRRDEDRHHRHDSGDRRMRNEEHHNRSDSNESRRSRSSDEGRRSRNEDEGRRSNRTEQDERRRSTERQRREDRRRVEEEEVRQDIKQRDAERKDELRLRAAEEERMVLEEKKRILEDEKLRLEEERRLLSEEEAKRLRKDERESRMRKNEEDIRAHLSQQEKQIRKEVELAFQAQPESILQAQLSKSQPDQESSKAQEKKFNEPAQQSQQPEHPLEANPQLQQIKQDEEERKLKEEHESLRIEMELEKSIEKNMRGAAGTPDPDSNPSNISSKPPHLQHSQPKSSKFFEEFCAKKLRLAEEKRQREAQEAAKAKQIPTQQEQEAIQEVSVMAESIVEEVVTSSFEIIDDIPAAENEIELSDEIDSSSGGMPDLEVAQDVPEVMAEETVMETVEYEGPQTPQEPPPQTVQIDASPISRPESVTLMPELVTAKPELVTAKPELVTAKPEVVTEKHKLVSGKLEFAAKNREFVAEKQQVRTKLPDLLPANPELVSSKPAEPKVERSMKRKKIKVREKTTQVKPQNLIALRRSSRSSSSSLPDLESPLTCAAKQLARFPRRSIKVHLNGVNFKIGNPAVSIKRLPEPKYTFYSNRLANFKRSRLAQLETSTPPAKVTKPGTSTSNSSSSAQKGSTRWVIVPNKAAAAVESVEVPRKSSGEGPTIIPAFITQKDLGFYQRELRRCAHCKRKYRSHNKASACLLTHGFRRCLICLDLISQHEMAYELHYTKFHMVPQKRGNVACPVCGQLVLFKGLSGHVSRKHLTVTAEKPQPVGKLQRKASAEQVEARGALAIASPNDSSYLGRSVQLSESDDDEVIKIATAGSVPPIDPVGDRAALYGFKEISSKFAPNDLLPPPEGVLVQEDTARKAVKDIVDQSQQFTKEINVEPLPSMPSHLTIQRMTVLVDDRTSVQQQRNPSPPQQKNPQQVSPPLAHFRNPSPPQIRILSPPPPKNQSPLQAPVQPKNLASSQPKNLAPPLPKNPASQQAKNLAPQQPKNLAPPQHKNLPAPQPQKKSSTPPRSVSPVQQHRNPSPPPQHQLAQHYQQHQQQQQHLEQPVIQPRPRHPEPTQPKKRILQSHYDELDYRNPRPMDINRIVHNSHYFPTSLTPHGFPSIQAMDWRGMPLGGHPQTYPNPHQHTSLHQHHHHHQQQQIYQHPQQQQQQQQNLVDEFPLIQSDITVDESGSVLCNLRTVNYTSSPIQMQNSYVNTTSSGGLKAVSANDYYEQASGLSTRPSIFSPPPSITPTSGASYDLTDLRRPSTSSSGSSSSHHGHHSSNIHHHQLHGSNMWDSHVSSASSSSHHPHHLGHGRTELAAMDCFTKLTDSVLDNTLDVRCPRCNQQFYYKEQLEDHHCQGGGYGLNENQRGQF